MNPQRDNLRLYYGTVDFTKFTKLQMDLDYFISKSILKEQVIFFNVKF